MSNADDKAFMDICQVPEIEALRQAALSLAPGLNGDAMKIGKVWRGKDGLQHRIADALEPIGLTAAEFNLAYDEACEALFCILNSRSRRPSVDSSGMSRI